MSRPITSRSTPTGVNGGFRPDIQGLRAIAVLLVALCHAGVPFLAGGYVGVDVFFVISGFLITGWLLRRFASSGRVPFTQFYAARARRILAASTLTLVVTVIAAWHYLNYIRAVSVFHDAIWATLFAANVHFAEVGTNYFAQDNPPSPLQNFWTLAVEEQFYIVWPALLALALFAARGRRMLLIIPVSAVVLASLGFCIHDTRVNPVGAYFSTFARGWEFGLGALIAIGAAELSRIPGGIRACMSWVGLAGIVLAGVLFTSTTEFPGYAALLPVLATVLVIVGGLGVSHRFGAGMLLRHQPFALTGDVSYAFYLWHWPILVIVAEHAGHDLTVWQNLGLLVIGFGVSLITYWSFENPIRHSRVLSMPRPALAMWPATVGMVLGLALVAVSSEPVLASTAAPSVPIVKHPLGTYTAAVRNSVAPARLASPIPTVLHPSIAQLPYDNPSGQGGCDTRGGLGLRCSEGATKSAKKFVVIGDSHAAAWMPALDYFGRKTHRRLIPVVHAGCTLGVASRPGSICAKWWPKALARIKALKPGFIVVAQYYDPRIPRQQMYAGLNTELVALRKRVKKIIFLEDPPRHPDINPVDCLLRSGATLGSCTLRFPTELNTEHVRIQKSVANHHDRYLRTKRWFCYGGECPMVVGRTIAYWDTEHITLTYSRQIAPAVSHYLQALVSKP